MWCEMISREVNIVETTHSRILLTVPADDNASRSLLLHEE